MKGVWTVIKTELRHYFNSPIGYVAIIAFLLASNFWFMKDFFINDRADMQEYFNILPWTLIIFVPAITMRSWAEERKSGTIELLLTSPLSYVQLIIGKFLSSWFVVALSIYLSFTIPFTVDYLGNPDKGVILAGYIAAGLLAAAYVAIGQLLSLLSNNQIVSFILSVIVFLVFILIGEPNYWPQGYRTVAPLFGMSAHFESIGRGLIDLKDLMYYLTLIIVPLVISHITLRRLKESGA